MYLTLTGITHIFRSNLSQATLSLKKNMRQRENQRKYSEGDIMLCQHFPTDSDCVHLVQLHDFYPSKYRPTPRVPASYLPADDVPLGRWNVFVVSRGSPYHVELWRCLDIKPGALDFRSGYDEMRIAGFLRQFFAICKGKRLRYNTMTKKFSPTE